MNKHEYLRGFLKTAARGDQAAKLLQLLNIQGTAPYTRRAKETLGAVRYGHPKPTAAEVVDLAKTLREMKARTTMAMPSRYSQYASRTLGLPVRPERRLRRFGEILRQIITEGPTY